MPEKEFPIKYEFDLKKEGLIIYRATELWVGSDDCEFQANALYDGVKKIFHKNPGKIYNILIDIRKTDQDQKVYLKERLVYLKLAKMKNFHRVAMLSNSILHKTFGELLTIAVNKKGRFQMFKDEKEAMDWVKEKIN